MPLTATREPWAWASPLSWGTYGPGELHTIQPKRLHIWCVCVCGESSGLGFGSSFYSLLSPLILSTS